MSTLTSETFYVPKDPWPFSKLVCAHMTYGKCLYPENDSCPDSQSRLLAFCSETSTLISPSLSFLALPPSKLSPEDTQ